MNSQAPTFPLWRLTLLSLAGSLLLSSCISLGAKFRAEGLEGIIVGKSTMAEVRAALGNPVTETDLTLNRPKRMHFGDEDTTTVWGYLFAAGTLGGEAKVRTIVVEFDRKGKVTDYRFESSFKEDKTPGTDDGNLRDFDIFLAWKKVVKGRTTSSQLQALLGDPSYVTSINKPGVKERRVYLFRKKEKDPLYKVEGGLSIDYEYRPTYFRRVSVDLGSTGKVVDLRGTSDFPADKDRFFTK